MSISMWNVFTAGKKLLSVSGSAFGKSTPRGFSSVGTSRANETSKSLLGRVQDKGQHQVQPVRGKRMFPHPKFLIKFSKETGNVETMEEVPERFFRLNNGLWIRQRHPKEQEFWLKNPLEDPTVQHHIFCTKRECKMLDKMVTSNYKRPHYYVDDIYEPYHKRHEIAVGRRKKFFKKQFATSE